VRLSNARERKIGRGDTHDRAACTNCAEITSFAIFCHRSFPSSDFDPKHTQIVQKHHPKVTLTFKHQFLHNSPIYSKFSCV